MRTPVIAGNWKMHTGVEEARALVQELKPLVKESQVEVVICPPATSLFPLRDLLLSSNIALGAQNMYYQKEGAYTGELSPSMIKGVGCTHVILGHSERRAIFLEDDALLQKKVKAALKEGLQPIFCIGETLEERRAGQTEAVVKRQLQEGTAGLEGIGGLIVAYEPVWAIGTGESATADEANRVIALIRDYLQEFFGPVAQEIRILYGGSVKPSTIDELMSRGDIDGALVGGASLDAASFARIVNFHG